MIKRTSLNLRLDLVADARDVPGIKGTGDELERLDPDLPLDGSPEPAP